MIRVNISSNFLWRKCCILRFLQLPPKIDNNDNVYKNNHFMIKKELCNSYTMGCPPVLGDNPQALASGLSYIKVDKHGITNLYFPTSV